MKFYTLDGNEIDSPVFVEKYGTSYYIDRPQIHSSCWPKQQAHRGLYG